jgi:hypothetical protein
MENNEEDFTIAYWKMTEAEAKAYRVAYIWHTQVQKIFPELTSYSKLPKSGDPRKSYLFKFCWKLVRLTRGLLKDDEYRLYIIANLQILKVHNAHVDINSLCGDKAWYRWLVWKRHFEIKSQQMAGDRLLEEPKQLDKRFFKEVGLTKKFLFEKCDGEPTLEKLKSFFTSPKMKIWVGGSKITPYYLILSPWVASICEKSKLMELFQIDPVIYEQKLDEVGISHFRKEFAHEYV